MQKEVPAGGAQQVVFDLVARRDHEAIFYEVKVLGEGRSPITKQLSALSAQARREGGRFRLVVVRPGREVEVDVEGIDEALRSALEDDPSGQLGTLGDRVEVTSVDGVEIERLRVLQGGRTHATGRAVASINQYAEGSDSLFASTDVPFGFDVVLDTDGTVVDEPSPTFDLDLSGWADEQDNGSGNGAQPP